ncbi:MAG: S8/S53 family peptidase [Candidatus Micrarchaeota archaeon]
MRLRHEQANSVLRKDRHTQTFGQKLKAGIINTAKKWGRGLLVAGLITAPSAGAMVGCQSTSPTQTSTQDAGSKTDQDSSTTETGAQTGSGIWAEPYRGEVLQDADGNYYMADRFIVKFKEPITREDVEKLLGKFNGRVTGQIPGLNAFEIEAKGKLETGISEMGKLEGVEFAGRNYYATATESPTPFDNDRYTTQKAKMYETLWWARQIQLTEGHKLLAEVGLHPITVAVLDTSFDLEMSQLHDRYVPKQYHKDTGDNDGNVTNANMWGNQESEDIVLATHGTRVVSILASSNNNQVENPADFLMNGVAYQPQIKILPIKLGSSNLLQQFLAGAGILVMSDDFRISSGLQHVDDLTDELNIKVVNLSFEMKKGARAMLMPSALSSLISKGVIVVASAGNNGQRINDFPFKVYPAGFPGVISVGATMLMNAYEGDEKRWVRSEHSSNYFVSSSNLAAPGGYISTLERYPDQQKESIQYGDGTSFSAPITAGLVALMKSINPELTYEETVELLQRSADRVLLDTDPKPELRNSVWNRINVHTTLANQLGVPFMKTEDNARTVTYLDCRVLHLREVLDTNNFKLINGKLIYSFESSPDSCYLSHDVETDETQELPICCHDESNYGPKYSGEEMSCRGYYNPDNIIRINVRTGARQDLNISGVSISSQICTGDYALWNDSIVYSSLNVGLVLRNLSTNEDRVLFESYSTDQFQLSGNILLFLSFSTGIHWIDLSSGQTEPISPYYYFDMELVGRKIVGNTESMGGILAVYDIDSKQETTIEEAGQWGSTRFMTDLQVSGRFVAYSYPPWYHPSFKLYELSSGTKFRVYPAITSFPRVSVDENAFVTVSTNPKTSEQTVKLCHF